MARFQGASQNYLLALQVSVILGSLVGCGLLVYYFLQVAWYWPIVLFVVGSILGGSLAGVLLGRVGLLKMSLISFIGWPASAIWAFYIVQGLHS